MVFYKIKNKIDAELSRFLVCIEKTYRLKKISPLLYGSIRDFVLRKGKRIRPILFLTGYLGYSDKPAPNIYTSALAIELLHDFMLVHDDIIDKSATRRGKLAMHTLLNKKIRKNKDIKFSGEDLAIITGDVMYAMAIEAFLAVKEEPLRKEKALRNFIKAAVHTGCGEFVELLAGTKNIDKISQAEILKIYDYKTGQYTFSTPLSSGAILAGASSEEINKLSRLGIYLGRAFQIKDDLLGMFAEERKIGKPTISDLQEAKKTLLIWHCYKNAGGKDKKIIKKILSKKKVEKKDLLGMRKIMQESGSVDYANKKIKDLVRSAEKISSSLKIKPLFKKFLKEYPQKLL
ncbi:MAG: hypothetical protein GF375_01740 [Candidatus Omnitrophica bacterium]|nr:hypothetical protein [Candidatus Omnitrophota bacterium]MBD3268846.1 hypothetical protein [Candidatus Omnitrophota bacterium]